MPFARVVNNRLQIFPSYPQYERKLTTTATATKPKPTTSTKPKKKKVPKKACGECPKCLLKKAGFGPNGYKIVPFKKERVGKKKISNGESSEQSKETVVVVEESNNLVETLQPIFTADAKVCDYVLKDNEWKFVKFARGHEPLRLHFIRDGDVSGKIRVLCVDGSRLLVNKPMKSSVEWKARPKWLQYFDEPQDLVVGLAFRNNADVDKCVSKVQELKLEVDEYEKMKLEQLNRHLEQLDNAPQMLQPPQLDEVDSDNDSDANTIIEERSGSSTSLTVDQLIEEREALLADLNGIDGDSNQSLEEIKQWITKYENLKRNEAQINSLIKAMETTLSKDRTESESSDDSAASMETVQEVKVRREEDAPENETTHEINGDEQEVDETGEINGDAEGLNGNEENLGEDKKQKIMEIQQAILEKWKEVLNYHSLLIRLT